MPSGFILYMVPSLQRVVLLALCIGGILTVRAFTISPITMELEPSGKKSTGTFRLHNDSGESQAVQITIVRRDMDETGKETQAPADDEFTVFPKQTVLKPHQIQAVRINWKGPTKLSQELAYRIIAEQLPVNLTKEPPQGTKLNLMVRYMGTLYVAPAGMKPDLGIESVAENNDGKIDLTIVNHGRAHAILRDFKLTLTSVPESGGEKAVRISSEHLESIHTQNILAGKRRLFSIAWPEGLPHGRLSAKLEWDEKP